MAQRVPIDPWYRLALNVGVSAMQRVFILYRQSVVDAHDIEPAMVLALGMLRRPGARVWWERADRFGFDPRFVDRMNERLK